MVLVLDVIASYRSINNQDILAVGMYKDFTEQMKIQRKLQASEDTYRTLVESLPEAIIVQRQWENCLFKLCWSKVIR